MLLTSFKVLFLLVLLREERVLVLLRLDDLVALLGVDRLMVLRLAAMVHAPLKKQFLRALEV